MTLRKHLSGVESVANLTWLGRLADRTALAVHRAEAGALGDDDCAALADAQALLVQLLIFAGGDRADSDSPAGQWVPSQCSKRRSELCREPTTKSMSACSSRG